MKGWIALMMLAIATALCFLAVGTAEGADYIVDDDNGTWADYGTVQEAINVASEGDTIYVYNGTYVDNHILNVTLTLIGNGSADTILDGNGSEDVLTITMPWVNVSGITVRNSGSGLGYYGIYLDGADNCNVSYVNGTSNGQGIVLRNGAGYNTIYRCEAYDNSMGIYLTASDNTVLECTMIDNSWGIYMNGAHRTTVSGNFVSGSGFGIDLVSSATNTDIFNNEVTGCNRGVNFQSAGANNNNISGNDLHDNLHGVFAYLDSHNNTIANNTIWNNTDYGIQLSDAHAFIIENNTVKGNDESIYLSSGAGWNLIQYNEIFDNSGYGVHITGSEKNVIHHNNFKDNNEATSQGYDSAGNNTWDDGAEGNYWDDWGGSGNYSIDGSADAADEYPLSDPTDTNAPEKVPEFGLLLMITTMLVAAVVLRRQWKR